MSIKYIVSTALVFMVLASAVEARHIGQQARARTHTRIRSRMPDDEMIVASAAGRRPHPAAAIGVQPQGRVFPGAAAIKKLVLLKFKKVIPISLILLRASDDNEAELVPVYPTSEIPADVQFIPTPNGISGHKDVQAIAIPTKLHQQLEASGLANLESIEALLNDAAQGEEVAIADNHLLGAMDPEDELLNVKEEDENQLLVGASMPEPAKTTTSLVSTLNSNNNANAIASANANANANAGLTVRRFATDDILRPGLRATPHTTIEEIPLFLYSAKDAPHFVYPIRKGTQRQPIAVRRFHA